jgi:Domain of unknown function (DUF4483)
MIQSDHNFYIKIQNSGNFLLLKDDVGKPKPPTRKLPSSEFIFGKKTPKDLEDAGQIMSSWHEHRKSLRTSHEKDYRLVNIINLSAKKQPKHYKRFLSVPINPDPKFQKKVLEIRHGTPAKPSTPIRALISNFYGQLAQNQTHLQYSPETQKITAKTRKKSKSNGYYLRYSQNSIQNNLKNPAKNSRRFSIN